MLHIVTIVCVRLESNEKRHQTAEGHCAYCSLTTMWLSWCDIKCFLCSGLFLDFVPGRTELKKNDWILQWIKFKRLGHIGFGGRRTRWGTSAKIILSNWTIEKHTMARNRKHTFRVDRQSSYSGIKFIGAQSTSIFGIAFRYFEKRNFCIPMRLFCANKHESWGISITMYI